MKKILPFLLILCLPAICWPDSESTIGGRTGTAKIWQDEGTSLRPRPYINITGQSPTCTDSGGKTVCDFAGLIESAADTIYLRLDGTAPPTADIGWGGFDIENLKELRFSNGVHTARITLTSEGFFEIYVNGTRHTVMPITIAAVEFLLLETGDFVLLETGDKIILE